MILARYLDWLEEIAWRDSIGPFPIAFQKKRAKIACLDGVRSQHCPHEWKWQEEFVRRAMEVWTEDAMDFI